VDDAAATRTILLQRPLCVYPLVAHYDGSGDPNDASSFVCRGKERDHGDGHDDDHDGRGGGGGHNRD